jgi:hypothetical protein
MLTKAVAIKPSYANNNASLAMALDKIGNFEKALVNIIITIWN